MATRHLVILDSSRADTRARIQSYTDRWQIGLMLYPRSTLAGSMTNAVHDPHDDA